MIKQTNKKHVYYQPMIILSSSYIEDSLANASATITIGEPGQNYSPNIEDWTDGSKGQAYHEF